MNIPQSMPDFHGTPILSMSLRGTTLEVARTASESAERQRLACFEPTGVPWHKRFARDVITLTKPLPAAPPR